MTAPPLDRAGWSVRTLPDSRPPASVWLRPPPAPDRQPTLDLWDAAEPAVRAAGPPAWTARPEPGLPDATAFATGLVRALLEVLDGRRSPLQLERWLDDQVLAAVLHRRRQRLRRSAAGPTGGPDGGTPRAAAGAVPAPGVLRSVRVQHPAAAVAEVSACLSSGRRTSAMALRLEARAGRWVCAALELG